MTTGKQEGEWIPWSGGECPVADNEVVRARFRFKLQESRPLFARSLAWKHSPSYPGGDIIAYRVVKQP